MVNLMMTSWNLILCWCHIIRTSWSNDTPSAQLRLYDDATCDSDNARQTSSYFSIKLSFPPTCHHPLKMWSFCMPGRMLIGRSRWNRQSLSAACFSFSFTIDVTNFVTSCFDFSLSSLRLVISCPHLGFWRHALILALCCHAFALALWCLASTLALCCPAFTLASWYRAFTSALQRHAFTSALWRHAITLASWCHALTLAFAMSCVSL